MKKLYTYILLMVCGLLFAGCQKDYLGGMWEIELEDYQGSDGKIYLNDQYYACLVNGDTVRMFVVDSIASYKGNIVLPTSEGGKAQLVLENDPIFEEGTQLSALYSPSAEHWDQNNNVGYSNNTATQYEHQSWREYEFIEKSSTRYQKMAAPMVGRTIVGDSNKLYFYNLCAMIQVHIQNNTGSPIDMFSIDLTTTTENASLTGKQTFTQNVNQAPIVDSRVERVESEDIITLFFNEPSVIENGGSAEYYIYVPAEQTCSYTINIQEKDQNSNGVDIYNRTTKAIKIPRNKIAKMEIILNPLVQDGSAGHPYLIESYEQLRNRLGATDGMSKHYKLVSSINVPSGFSGFEGTFTGTLDGNDNVIMYSEASGGEGTSGLFQKVGGGAMIKNLNIWVNISKTSGPNVGGLANKIQGGDATKEVLIQDCVVGGMITHTGTMDCGGLIGTCWRNGNVTIKNCDSEVEVTGVTAVGGIVGRVMATASTINISNCKNMGLVSGTTSEIGGIVGAIRYTEGTSTLVMIDKCVNTATISGGSQVGGIVGCSDNSELIVINCANRGAVSGTTNIGGILGHGSGKLYNSYSVGDISGSDVNPIVGGLVGEIEGGSLNNMYVGGSVSGKWIVGGTSTTSTVNYANVYSPSGVESENGCGGINQYIDWSVGTSTLATTLNGNGISGSGLPTKELWFGSDDRVDGSGQPQLLFEVAH